MKLKLLNFLLLFLTMFQFVNAQSVAKEPINMVLRTGVHFSRYSFSNLSPQFGKPTGEDAFYAGVQIEIPVAKSLYLIPEIGFAKAGVQSYHSSYYLVFDDMSYLQIPLLLKYKLGKVGLYAGPQLDFLLSANGSYVENNDLFRGDVKNNSFKKSGLSAVFGIGWTFKYRFGIDARYQAGLGNVRASNGSTLLTSSGKIQAHAFQTGLFYRFGKKPK